MLWQTGSGSVAAVQERRQVVQRRKGVDYTA